MSVISCKLMATGATGSLSNRNQGTYQHNYEVITNDDGDDQVVVLVQAQSASPDPVPAKNTHYNVLDGEDTGALLQNTSCRRDPDDEGNRRRWIITATWGPPEGGTSTGEPPNSNPLLEPVRFSLEWLPNQKGVSHTSENPPKAIVNSAFDFFEGVTIDEPYLVVVAVRNESNLYQIMSNGAFYQNTVNTNIHWGGAPRTFRVESIQCSDLQELNGIAFYRVTYRLAFNPLTWDLLLVDRGTQAYNIPKDQGGEKIPVRVIPGVNNPNPRNLHDLLDMANLFPDGTQVPSDHNPPGFFKLLEGGTGYRVYRETDFSGLGLPNIPGQP